MATLRNVCLLMSRHRVSVVNKKNLSTGPRLLAGYWNKDWQPGPLPRTPEERAAAAKKYGLRPEDYETLPDGSLGDYPNLPPVSNQWRDPFEDYDVPTFKRNFGEPLHPDHNVIGYDQWDESVQSKYTLTQMFARFLLIAFGFAGMTYLLNPYPYILPQMPKQYPFNDLYLEKGGDPEKQQEIKHYTFVKADS